MERTERFQTLQTFQTLRVCLSANRMAVLIVAIVIASLGIAYPLGYVFQYVVPNAANLPVLLFWWCGLLTLIMIMALIFAAGIIIAFIIHGIISAAKYCRAEWNRAKHTVHAVHTDQAVQNSSESSESSESDLLVN